jgi:acetylornithine deacetylase/succinyl-diaminopimelate desuccinylase-like protein
MTLGRVHAYIDFAFQDHLRKTQEFLRLPGISSTGQGLQETAIWLSNYIQTLDADVQLAGKPDAPILMASFDRGKPKTLLVYGMYDVQDVRGQDWTSPPFEANIQSLPNVGPCIIARGACNSKGPLMGFLNTIHAFERCGEIPLNLILTIEGEEEIGSPTLPEFYRQNQEWLESKADAGFEPFWAEYGTDVERPIISLGSKGILSLELICRGGDWGGPTSHSVHSSVGAWISSPVWRLIKAVSTFQNDKEGILIEGFDEGVVPPSDEEEGLLVELNKTFDEKRTLEVMSARRFKYNEQGVDLLRRYLYSPSIQLGRLSHTGDDVIPSEVHIQLLIRLVPQMDPAITVDKIRKHLDKFGYADIETRVHAHYPCSKTNFHQEIVQCMLETYHEHGVKPQVWPISASATPYYLFSEMLNLPYTWGGLGKAGNSHIANEYASVEGLRLFEKSLSTFLYKYARK